MIDIVCLTDDCPNNENGCCNGESCMMDFPCDCDTEICKNYLLKNIIKGEMETIDISDDSILQVYGLYTNNEKDITIFRKIKNKVISMRGK